MAWLPLLLIRCLWGGLACIMWYQLVPHWFRASRVSGVMLGTLMLCGALLPIVMEQGLLFAEVWSGLAIALSLTAYISQQRKLAIGWGLMALVFRELAAPYVLLCLILAARERRWSEVIAWISGGVCYLLAYYWHVQQILPRIPVDGVAHSQSWLAWEEHHS